MSRLALPHPPSRRALLAAQVLLWVCCLSGGLFGVLAASARYACGPGQDDFACRPAATTFGVLLAAASVVILVVVLVAVRVSRRAEQRVVVLYLAGVLGGLACLTGAALILQTS